MKKIGHFFKILPSNNFAVFLFLFILNILAYQSLFHSYFESDEWFYFTYYLPLTREPYGWITALLATFTESGYISGGLHVVPIASLVYYLNTKFFGLNFIPYAFLSLLVHSINSYLVFIFVKVLLRKRPLVEKGAYALLSALFFALSPIPMHAFTGFAAFYGQNVLSTTFFLLCILFYELALIKGKRKYIFCAVFFLFSALLTQESTFFLFFVLLVITVFKKRVFSYKFLRLLWVGCLFIYTLIRFLIPNVNFIVEGIAKIFSPAIHNTSQNILAQVLSVHPNLSDELLFRSVIFPLRMLGSIFIPPEAIRALVQKIAPLISPYPPGGDNSIQTTFINYSGQSIVIYVLALIILVLCATAITAFVKKNRSEEASLILTGLSIILFGALPLVAVIFTFPLWGYEIYFDSRYYYTPHIGAAILFPFLIYSLANFIAQHIHIKKSLAIFLVLSMFVFCNIADFSKNIRAFTQNYTEDRRNIINQLTTSLPKLAPKTVFYIEKDGTSPFVSLPFFTSVPPALAVVYYSRSPLPDSFYNRPLFSGEPEGYQYENGRGFGYYTSKEKLTEAIHAKKFTADDVYAFYYYGSEAKIKDITPRIREELKRQ